MSSNIEKINRIDFVSILNKLGYFEGSGFRLQGNLIKMIDNGKVTGGWNGKVDEGYLKCQSGKKPGRFEGDRISMIEDKFNFSKAEAISWYEENFPNELTKTEWKGKKDTVKDEWSKFSELSPLQISFLHSRKIKFDLVKQFVRDFQGTIGLGIVSENGSLVSYQGRNIDANASKKDRYRIRSGGGAKGLFADFDNIDPDKEVILCEGMTDWLTMRQHTPQVVALVSKDNGIEQVKALKNKYKFIFVPDNDEAGDETVEKLKEMGMGILRLNQYESEELEIKDLNDLWVHSLNSGLDGETFITMIMSDATRPKKNIDFALEKAIKNRDIGSRLVGDKIFDEATGGITPGSVMIINGLSGEGKTTTLDWIITAMIKHNKRMGFCSIDDDVGKMLAMFLGRYFHKDWRTEIYPEIEEYVMKYGIEKFDDFLVFDDINTLDGFQNVVKQEKLDILIVDYIQVVEGLPGKDMKDKMLAAIRGLQRLAIDTHTAVICLSQVSKGEDKIPVLNRTPMESQYIKSAADTFVNVGIFGGKHSIGFVKNKYGQTEYKLKEFDTKWDKKTGDITIWNDTNASSF